MSWWSGGLGTRESIEAGGRVCGGQQVAGENLFSMGGGEIPGDGLSIDPLMR
jgi:hypothetical protein